MDKKIKYTKSTLKKKVNQIYSKNKASCKRYVNQSFDEISSLKNGVKL